MFNFFNTKKRTKHYSINQEGNDYIVGDIHGEFNSLEEKLLKIKFDPKKDRLFSVGDLTDRGSSSKDVTKWIDKKWFIPVKGNHEEMLIAVSKTIFTETAVNFYHNGGQWFFYLDKKTRNKIAKYYKTFPTAITVETEKGNVGIVHADCPTRTWGELIKILNSDNYLEIEKKCLWSRYRLKNSNEIIPDVRAVIVGHMKQENIKINGNIYLIDTGSGYKGGELTILDLKTLLPVTHPSMKDEDLHQELVI